MKKLFGFLVIVTTAFLCLEVGVKAIGRSNSIKTTGSQVLTATAYKDKDCHSGTIIHSYVSSMEASTIVLSVAYIEVNGSKKIEKKGYTIGNTNPIAYSGAKQKKVHSRAECSAGPVDANTEK